MAKALGRYQIVCRLGQGGQAVVYEAFDPDLGRKVALKVLRPGARSDDAMERLLREARAAAKLDHPNIVSVYDVGEVEAPRDALRAADEQSTRAAGPPADGGPAAEAQRPPPPPRRLRRYLAMELVEGGSLQAALDRREFSVREAVSVAYLVARAAHRAHSQGVIHRDIKPGNVLLALDGTPKLTDFGFALDAGEHERLTLTGTTMGTPAYMAPEQALGRSRDADARTDVYAIGALLYRILAGRPPFTAETSLELLRKAAHETPRPPSDFRAAMPPQADTICLKCLEKDPARRYQTAEELAEDCRRLLERGSIRARRTGPAYRARTALMRHKAPAAALAVALAACAGLEIRTRSAVRRERAEAAKLSAEAANLRSAALPSAGEAESLEDGIAGVRRETARLREELARLHRRSGARVAGRRKAPRGDLPVRGEAVAPPPIAEGPGREVPPAPTTPAPPVTEKEEQGEGRPPPPKAAAKRYPGFYVEAESGTFEAEAVRVPGASGGWAVPDFNKTGRKLSVHIVLSTEVRDAELLCRAVPRFRRTGAPERMHRYEMAFALTAKGTNRQAWRMEYIARFFSRGMYWQWRASLGDDIPPGRYRLDAVCVKGDGGAALDVIGIGPGDRWWAAPNRLIRGRLEERGFYVDVAPWRLRPPERRADTTARPGPRDAPATDLASVPGFFAEAEDGGAPIEEISASGGKVVYGFNGPGRSVRAEFLLPHEVRDALVVYRAVRWRSVFAPRNGAANLTIGLMAKGIAVPLDHTHPGGVPDGMWRWHRLSLGRDLPPGKCRLLLGCQEGPGDGAVDVIGVMSKGDLDKLSLPNRLVRGRLEADGYYVKVAAAGRRPAPAPATVPSAAESAPSAQDPAPAKVAPPPPVGRVPGYFAEAETAVSKNTSVAVRSDASRGKVLRDVDRTGAKLDVEFVIVSTVSQAMLALRLVATGARELGFRLVISEPETGEKYPRPVDLSATDTMQWSYVPLHLELLPGRYWVGLTSLPGDGGADLDMIGVVSAADPYARRLPNRLVGGRLEEGGRYVEVGTPKVAPAKPEKGRHPGGKEPAAAGRSASGSESKEPPDGLTIRRIIPESRWQRVEGYFVEAESGIKQDKTVWSTNVSGDQVAPGFNRTGHRLRLAIYLRRSVADAFLAYRYVKRHGRSAPPEARHKLIFTLTSLDTFKMVANRPVVDELKGSGPEWGWVALGKRLPAGSYRVGVYCQEGDGGSALDVVGVVAGAECRRGWLPNHMFGRRLQERGYYIEVAPVVRMPILPRRLR